MCLVYDVSDLNTQWCTNKALRSRTSATSSLFPLPLSPRSHTSPKQGRGVARIPPQDQPLGWQMQIAFFQGTTVAANHRVSLTPMDLPNSVVPRCKSSGGLALVPSSHPHDLAVGVAGGQSAESWGRLVLIWGALGSNGQALMGACWGMGPKVVVAVLQKKLQKARLGAAMPDWPECCVINFFDNSSLHASIVL